MEMVTKRAKKLCLKINVSIGLFLLISALILSSCIYFRSNNAELEATIAAMSLQGTVVAQQATIDAQNIQMTMMSQQATLLAQQVQPSLTPANVLPVQPTPAVIQGTATETVSTISTEEMDQRIKAAKILLFEDSSGNRLGLLRYVKEALDTAGYAYTDVGSAQGWLKDQLISLKDWDLIIVAAELSGMTPGEGKISGEFFGYLDKYIDKGTAIIMELPTLNDIFQGEIRPILDKCGIQFQDNWLSPPSSSVWFILPEHAIFHEPNEVGPSLRDYRRIWSDSGDLVEIKYRNNQPVGDAVILAGTRIDKKTTHGTLTTCLGGRMILQTFATHHYQQEIIVRLWQNYVYDALKNHFLYLSK